MSPINRRRIQQAVSFVGDELTLPPHPDHPKGRNPYAHIWQSIKQRFGSSYKDLDDSMVDEVHAYVMMEYGRVDTVM